MIEGGELLLGDRDDPHWNESIEVRRKHFPILDARRSGIFPVIFVPRIRLSLSAGVPLEPLHFKEPPRFLVAQCPFSESIWQIGWNLESTGVRQLFGARVDKIGPARVAHSGFLPCSIVYLTRDFGIIWWWRVLERFAPKLASNWRKDNLVLRCPSLATNYSDNFDFL